MDIDEYKQAVINLFKSGKATDKQWVEMAAAVLGVSENHPEIIEEIDAVVDPE